MPMLFIASLFSLQCTVCSWHPGFFQGGHAKSNPFYPCSKHRMHPTQTHLFPLSIIPAFHLLTDVTCFPSDRFLVDAVLLLDFCKPAIQRDQIGNLWCFSDWRRLFLENRTGNWDDRVSAHCIPVSLSLIHIWVLGWTVFFLAWFGISSLA